jgi:hypothetical protein
MPFRRTSVALNLTLFSNKCAVSAYRRCTKAAGVRGAQDLGFWSNWPWITNALLYRLSYRGDLLILLNIFSPRHCGSSDLLPRCYPFAAARRLSSACRKACEYRSNVMATVA